jgi:GDP-4-dehydro-6-deoxy-D-mannose reductase
MKVLITGAAGFAGQYLADECRRAGWDVLRQDISPSEGVYALDICDSLALRALVREQAPDACIHLAGMSYVPDGLAKTGKMYAVNLMGTVNLLDSFLAEMPQSRILVVSSASIYQTAQAADGLGAKVRFEPESIYAVSKLAADLTTLSYAEHHGLQAMTVRPVNHIGPGQSERFVVSAFARQLKEIALGLRDPAIRVGNLKSRRDFIDVRDVVRAYRLLIERGEPGRHYDLSSGRLVEIREVLDKLFTISGVEPCIETDEQLYRPTDSSPALDSSALRKATGWEIEMDLEQTLRDIYDSIEL